MPIDYIETPGIDMKCCTLLKNLMNSTLALVSK